MARSRGIGLTEIADGVHFVQGPAANWVVLVGDDSVTVIDTGYPADADLVDESLRRAAPQLPVTDILITHGHSDHVGSVRRLVDQHGCRVWAAAAEIPNIVRDELHQVGIRDLLPHLWRPRYARWAWHAVRAGGLRDPGVGDVRTLEPDVAVTMSGHRLLPRLTPGHTPGHLVFELIDHDAVVTGDAVITAHPTSPRIGRQILAPLWHWDTARARAEGTALMAERRVILPGHGAPGLPGTGAEPRRGS